MDETLLLCTAVALYYKLKKPKRRWADGRFLQRETIRSSNLSNDIPLEPSEWRNQLCMDDESYFELLKLVTPLIQKQDTNMRQSITAHERLTATLQYLTTGIKFRELSKNTNISSQLLGSIVSETCKAIQNRLESFMKMPENEEDWRNIAKDYEEKCNFPHCLGVINGKHIRILQPREDGPEYRNYKKLCSVVLLGCVNANYEYIWTEVVHNERQKDGTLLAKTKFYEQLENYELNVPEDEPINGTLNDYPFVFIVNEAFPSRADFVQTYPQKVLSVERKVFNDRLSRAKMTSELAFNTMASRFRILQSVLHQSPERVERFALTCCLLHNFLRNKSSTYNIDDEDPQELLTPLQYNKQRCIKTRAKRVRNMFADYFNGEGATREEHEQI